MGKLEGKVALVTGSGRNIGRATVLKLAGEGAHVVVNARSNQQEAETVAREARDLGVKAVPVLADVGKKAEVEALAAKALSEFGRVDILINNAAIRPHKPFTETTDADWELIRSVVLDGPLYLTRALIEPMVKNRYGRILFFVGDGAISAQRQRPHSFICSEDGADRHGARARLGIRAAITSGLMSFRRAASIRGATIPSGITVACRTPPASRSAGKAASTRSPRPACSWSVRMAASSPARRSTSMAAHTITDVSGRSPIDKNERIPRGGDRQRELRWNCLLRLFQSAGVEHTLPPCRPGYTPYSGRPSRRNRSRS